jgi:hypothetical protein
MIDTTNYLSGPLASATIPSELILQPAQAWLLLFTVLVLCCAVLWLLTRPLNSGATPTEHPQPPRRGRVLRRWRQQPLTASGRRRPMWPGWLTPRASGRV